MCRKYISFRINLKFIFNDSDDIFIKNKYPSLGTPQIISFGLKPSLKADEIFTKGLNSQLSAAIIWSTTKQYMSSAEIIKFQYCKIFVMGWGGLQPPTPCLPRRAWGLWASLPAAQTGSCTPRKTMLHSGRPASHPAPGESVLDRRAVEGKVGLPMAGWGRQRQQGLPDYSLRESLPPCHVTRTKNHEPFWFFKGIYI